MIFNEHQDSCTGRTVFAQWKRGPTSTYTRAPSPALRNELCIIYSYFVYFIMYAWVSYTECRILKLSHLSRPLTITQLKDGHKEILTQTENRRRRFICFVRNASSPPPILQVKSRSDRNLQNLKQKTNQEIRSGSGKAKSEDFTGQISGLSPQQKLLSGTKHQFKFSSCVWRWRH